MLDRNIIAQLSQLKEDIIATKDYAEGAVVGTSGRYGFVKLDDGRSAFLNPDKMQRVLPGDRVKVNVVKNNSDQLEAELEELLAPNAELRRFVGRYKTKGNAHFVVPEGQTRWIFLPPQNRLKCSDDDWVVAELLRHPFSDGKAAAKGVARIGSPGEDYLDHNLVIARFGLHRHWPKDVIKQGQELAQATPPPAALDLNDLPFVTIDSAATRDMDDALFISPRAEGGWDLLVAIADPASRIAPSSLIAKSARHYGQSVYLPGRSLPMLPDNLATDVFSLLPEQVRATLVCTVQLAADGAVINYKFEQASIRSRHKLTYQAVAEFLAGSDQALTECDEPVRASLRALGDASKVRAAYRQQHHLMFEDQPDYDYLLNKQGLIDSVQRRDRNDAHRLVEEAMVLVNVCAGELLAEHQAGLFAVHQGFRPERLGEVKALLREALGSEHEFTDVESLDGYLALVKWLRQSDEHRYLLAPLKRMMQNSELSNQPAPHMCMGFRHYAPVTSPIRRYADLCNQWTIHQILQQQKPQKLADKLLEQLREAIANGRQAARQLEQTLWVRYLQERIGEESTGVIRIVTQQGFGVRMVDTGIEGFVQFGKKTQKAFDAKRMTLTVGERCFALDGEVQVKVVAVDLEKRRVKLELAADGAAEQAQTQADEEALTAGHE